MPKPILAKLWKAITLALLLSLLAAPFANATVWSDKQDYQPGTVVTIRGDNSEMEINQPPYVDGHLVLVSATNTETGWSGSCQAIVGATIPEEILWQCKPVCSPNRQVLRLPVFLRGPYPGVITIPMATSIFY